MIATERRIFSTSSNHAVDFLGDASGGSVADLIKTVLDADLRFGHEHEWFERLRAEVRETGRMPFPISGHEATALSRLEGDALLDYLAYRYRFFLAGSRRVELAFPPYILIEPVSACNLRCPMCFQSDRSFTRKPFMGLMDFDLFTSVVDQAAEGGCRAITMASRGEPLMHPRIGEMLSHLSSKKAFYDIKLNTNGTFLTERLCHELLSSDLNVFVFSIDHYEKERYEAIRVNAVFEEVRRNVDRFLEIRETQYPESRCEVRISGVRVDPEMDEERFRAYWGDRFDNIALVDMIERWDTYQNEPDPHETSPCSQLWDRMYVWFDGSCNPCDADYKSTLCYGNAANTPIAQIWGSDAVRGLRDIHTAGARPSVSPCDRCGKCFGE
jgi:pyruvate-formate lyase-activating enzyme